MPKIINCSKKDILTASKELALKNGYYNLSIKSVAEKCNIAVGTIYNYFPSKEYLVASFILEDWTQTISNLKEILENNNDPLKAPELIYIELINFIKLYKPVFFDSSIVHDPKISSLDRHFILVNEISKTLEKYSNLDHKLATFISEILLTYSKEYADYSEIKVYIEKLIK